jgi:RNA polymerase sigma factor for flagellar operon FliA
MAAAPDIMCASATAGDQDLWALWRGGDERARDTLAAHYADWTRRLAREVFMRVRGRSADWPDYVQNASLGLVEAMATYDPARGVPFEAYARHRVRGAVFNGLRALLVTRPAVEERSWREHIDSLLDEQSDDPLEQLVGLVSSLGLGYAMGSWVEPEQTTAATPYDEAVREQLRSRIERQLVRLPEKERLVLQLHYLHHMAFANIAQMLSLTKGRISQLHRQALARLKLQMAAEAWHLAL